LNLGEGLEQQSASEGDLIQGDMTDEDRAKLKKIFNILDGNYQAPESKLHKISNE